MRKTILLVEDDAQLAKMLAGYLHEKKFIVEMAHNGTEALIMLPVVRPDLIILDIVLPEMHGVDVLKQIQSKTSEFAKVPVIVLTNLSTGPRGLLDLGFKIQDYCIKAETSLDNLHQRVKKALGS